LNEKNHHSYLGAFDGAIDLEMQDLAYRPNDTIVDNAKILFRPDDWDRGYFPHVLKEVNDAEPGA
jgi:hypothetical protein